MVASEGGKPVKIIDLPPTVGVTYTWPASIQWSRDGLALQYIDTPHGVSNILRQPLSGGPPKQTTDFKSDYLATFDWSPDGKFLAVARYSYSSDVVLMSNAK